MLRPAARRGFTCSPACPAARIVPARILGAPASRAGAWLLAASLLLAPAEPALAQADSVFLEDLTWTELRDAVQQGKSVAIVPVGGTEQSGPAIALGKHNLRVRILAERIAHELGDALVAPVIAYVPEGSIEPPSSHMRFPGTISVPVPVFDATLEAAARSLRAHGFRDIVFLGDHGGYQSRLALVAARLDRAWAHGAARAWAPPEYYEASTTGFAKILRERGFRDDEIGSHAGLADTSLQLALAPQTVRPEVLAAGKGFDARGGVYGGDPRRADAAAGQAGADEIVKQTAAAIRRLVAHGRDGVPAGHAGGAHATAAAPASANPSASPSTNSSEQ